MQKLILGCGYLGRRVAAAWIGQGHQVTALTRTSENAEQLRRLGITAVRGDVTDRSSLSNLPDADVILYAVGFDRRCGLDQRTIYVDGLSNVLGELTARSRFATWSGRFVYISSSSVYGQTTGEWVDETSPCEPIASNGQACLDAERVLWTSLCPPSFLTDATPSFAVNILRLAGLYGPGRLLRRLDALRSSQPLGGNPDGYLNLVHIDDAVQAVLACEVKGVSGETYLISDDRPVLRRDYYETLARLAETPPPVFAETAETMKTAASSVQTNRRCRNRRLHEELDMQLVYPDITTGLPQAIAAS